jgi:hypothetical protein
MHGRIELFDFDVPSNFHKGQVWIQRLAVGQLGPGAARHCGSEPSWPTWPRQSQVNARHAGPSSADPIAIPIHGFAITAARNRPLPPLRDQILPRSGYGGSLGWVSGLCDPTRYQPVFGALQAPIRPRGRETARPRESVIDKAHSRTHLSFELIQPEAEGVVKEVQYVVHQLAYGGYAASFGCSMSSSSGAYQHRPT